MFSSRLKIWICAYFAFLVILAPFIFPDGDAFYYWDWGNHLALSYLDGPPMIAYMMRLMTILFGNTFFAINMVAVACSALICYFIYRLGVLLRDQKTGMFAAALWLFYPLVAQAIFIRVTYDVPENLFSVMSLYFAARYALTQKTRFLYGIGLAAGLLLLSKYTGIVVIATLFIYYVGHRELRAVFRNPHFYGAFLLALGLFSPVLIWNIQHDWASMYFQLGQHTSQVPMPLTEHVLRMLHFLWSLLIYSNILLIIPLLFFGLRRPSLSQRLVRHLLITAVLTFSAFWFMACYSGQIKVDYFVPVTLSLALLSADILMQGQYQKFSVFLLGLFLLVSVCFVMGCTIWIAPLISYEYPVYLLQKNLIIQAQKEGPAQIITTGWNSVPRLEFLAKELHLANVILPKNKCDLSLDGGYQFLKQAPLQSGQFQRAIYLNVRFAYPACVTPYFKTCTPLQTIPYRKMQLFTHQEMAVNVYWSSCHN